MKAISGFMISWICLVSLYAQPPLDYHPRLLLRELADLNEINPVLTEIILPDELKNHLQMGKFFIVGEPSGESKTRYVYIGRVNSCRSGGCTGNYGINSDLTSEYFDYFVLFDPGCRVYLVKVFNYQATHGQEITAAGWLRQFIGYSGEKELNAGKNIDAISGATISVTGIILDIESKTKILKQLVRD